MSRVPLLLALLVGAALPASAQDRRDRDEEFQSRIDTTINFDRRGIVALSAGSGEIIVTAWDRPQVRVRARSERSTIRIDATSARVSLDLTRSRGGDTRFEVTVPTGVQVTARTTNGDISITGTRGAVEATTQSGDLSVDEAIDAVELRTFSGDILARNLSGTVEVNSLSGDVSLTVVRGNVDATTVSGDVDLRGIAGRFVTAKSTSGDISYDGTIDSTGRYELTSHSGGVYITIPPGTGALMTVSTYTGSIESDFPITLKPGEHGIGMSRQFTFEIGKGNARVSAESFSGDITIRSKGSRTTDR